MKEVAKVTVGSSNISKDPIQEVFRAVFSVDNTITELFQKEVTVNIDNIIDLNHSIVEKLKRNNINNLLFNSLTRFDEGRVKEHGSFEKFISDNWKIPDSIDSIQLNWKFLYKEGEKGSMHTLSVLLSSSLKPQHIMNAMLSKDPSELEKLSTHSVPVSCRIDFSDQIISQELMNLVSEWNKGLPSPEYLLPIMKFFKIHEGKIRKFVSRSLPVAVGFVGYSYYCKQSSGLNLSAGVSVEYVKLTVNSIAVSALMIYLSSKFGIDLSNYISNNLRKFGNFNVFNITKGDDLKQGRLIARSTRSLYSFAAYSLFAIALNVAGGILTAVLWKP